MLKAVLFDAYGTLISTGDGSARAAREILALNRRTDMDPAAFYGRWKKLHRQHIDSRADFLTEEEVFCLDLCQLYREYNLTRDARQDVELMLDTLGRRTAFPEAEAVLRKLEKDYIIAIGSTTDTAPLLRDLERNGLEVPYIFTSESIKAYKPEKVFYEKMLYSLGLLPSEVLFVGDSLNDDVLGPQSVGIKACWLNRKDAASGEVRQDFGVRELGGIFRVLEELTGLF